MNITSEDWATPPTNFDPQTGAPLASLSEARFDPFTGEPLTPLAIFDRVTGKRLPARSTRWLARRPGIPFYIAQGLLALFLAINLVGMFFLPESKLVTVIGAAVIGVIGFCAITTVSYAYRRICKLP